MAMPNNLVFIRHGQSEANIIQKAEKSGKSHEHAARINDRPDWQQRLSARGIEQAKNAKIWVDENLGGAKTFDYRYVSPFLRTRETAAYVGGKNCNDWVVDDRVVERSWGTYGVLTRKEQAAQYPLTMKLHKATPWFVRFDGGESMPDVSGRYRDIQATWHRQAEGGNVLVVTHGDFINVARYNIERMLPEQWEAMDKDPAYTMRNCTIVQYSRVNPQDESDVRDKLHWRRMIYPDAVQESPDGGEWVELASGPRFSGTELLKQADLAPPLLSDAVDNE